MKTKWSIVLLPVFVAVTLLWRHFSGSSTAEALYKDDDVRMKIAEAQPVAYPMKEAEFRLTIVKTSGQPVTAANVTMNIAMPDMLCGTFPADIVETSPGVYRATAVPVMRGRWQAEALLLLNGRRIMVETSFKVR